MAQICGAEDKVVDITVAIDKLDKIGLDAVKAELLEKGLSPKAVEMLEPILCLRGDNAQKIRTMRELMSGSETGLKGLDELDELLSFIQAAGVKTECEIDLSLARGLNYYTGAIFEIKALDYQIGSISGGGRYDNLTGIFGLQNMSGVGISFGADRIYDVLKALDAFPKSLGCSTTLLVANMGNRESSYTLGISNALRAKGISVELYPEASKLKKQFDYAEKKQIPFLSICGESEMQEGLFQIKNLSSGEQKAFAKEDIEGILAFIKG